MAILAPGKRSDLQAYEVSTLLTWIEALLPLVFIVVDNVHVCLEYQIESISTSIQAIRGMDITWPNLPLSNLFEGIPIPRIDPDIYITITR